MIDTPFLAPSRGSFGVSSPITSGKIGEKGKGMVREREMGKRQGNRKMRQRRDLCNLRGCSSPYFRLLLHSYPLDSKSSLLVFEMLPRCVRLGVIGCEAMKESDYFSQIFSAS